AGLDMDIVNIRGVYDIDPIERWHSDSVVIIGDAAHSMLHHQGQGANSAILDAGVLADCLRDTDTVAAALAAFQAQRKPVTDELQRISRQGWTEDEVQDVFPGQKPAAQQPAPSTLTPPVHRPQDTTGHDVPPPERPDPPHPP